MGRNLKSVDLGKNLRAMDICAASAFACAVTNNHKVKCWGDNSKGQLGQGRARLSSGDLGDALPFTDLGDDFGPETISYGGRT